MSDLIDPVPRDYCVQRRCEVAEELQAEIERLRSLCQDHEVRYDKKVEELEDEIERLLAEIDRLQP